MLARVANSLYWTGRYIERSEHLARFLNVQYFSTFDAPMSQEKEVILRSILYMGSPRDISQQSQANAEIPRRISNISKVIASNRIFWLKLPLNWKIKVLLFRVLRPPEKCS